MTRLATLILLAVCTSLPVHSALADDELADHKRADDGKADGLARLYAEAARKSGTQAARTHDKHARYGAVAMGARPSPVMSVIRLKRQPDGSIGLSCSVENTGFHGADRINHPGENK